MRFKKLKTIGSLWRAEFQINWQWGLMSGRWHTVNSRRLTVMPLHAAV
jgi:hypothetical protein